MRRPMLVGALLGAALILGVLELGAATGAPSAGLQSGVARFQAILLHPNANSAWSGILDTQTGCVWVFVSQDVPAHPTGAAQVLRAFEGANMFSSVAYDPSDYAAFGVNADKTLSAAPLISALMKEQKACSVARRSAIGLPTNN